MRRWLPVFGAAVYVAGLIAMAPATLLDARLAAASGGRLRLTDARGTVWSGQGVLELRDGAGRAGFAAPLAWRLGARSLLEARLVYGVRTGNPASRFKVALAPRRVEVEDADLRFPAQALGLAVPQLAVLELRGELRLHAARLSAGSRYLAGDATLVWRDAASALASIAPLGDYELRLEGTGDTVSATLRTLDGPLHLEGRTGWTLGTRPALAARAEIAPAQREALAPLLRLIAVEQGDGSFRLTLQ